MPDLNTVLTRLNDRLLRLEGELFVLRSLARATLTAGDDHAARMRKLVEAAKIALDDEAKRELDKPTRKYVDAATALVEEMLFEPTPARPLFACRRRPAGATDGLSGIESHRDQGASAFSRVRPASMIPIS